MASRRRANYVKKRRTMQKVGQSVGSANTKWDTLDLANTPFTGKVLQQLSLLNVTKTNGSSAYDRRLKDQLNFRGIKFCMNFRVEGAMGTAKAWVNVAVISPKSDLASDEAIPNTDFFRNPSGATRDIDFGNAGLSNLDYHCTAINTDKYNIHKRSKITVGPTQSTEGYKERYLEWYMPIKRQIRYEDNTNFPSGKNMYLVWWYSASDGGSPANAVSVQYRVTRYFRETVGL